MSVNDYTLRFLINEKQKQLLFQAHNDRLVRALKAENWKFANRLLVKLGEFLIHSGSRLKRRYQPAIRPGI